MTSSELLSLRGQKLMCLDYGDVRIGVAVCDEMHIVVSTRPIVMNTDQVFHELAGLVQAERIDAVIVGVPRHHDNRITPIIERIMVFIQQLRVNLTSPVFEADEAFSTKEARQVMIASGVKKSRRQAKGVKDQVAAAVILRYVIEEIRSIPSPMS